MLYISAQPDNIYFTWQLEIQLRNFQSLGIKKNDIHILISYDKTFGLNPIFQEFITTNDHLANFYTYPDLRSKPKYTSSIRPNILKQHFIKFPELELKTLFYHDSDILLSRIPAIENLEKTDTCYVSDTRSYLNVNYILSTGSEKLLEDMLLVVGLNREKLEKEDHNTGGAQYILKNIGFSFWEKVERDSEQLFILMKRYNDKLWEEDYADKKSFRSQRKGIQAWCSDMWAVLWNLWLDDKKVEIHAEMTFSWPYNLIADWNRHAILHYSGNVQDKNKYFRKVEYINYKPWYDDTLDNIPDTSCSIEIVRLIKARRKELDESRPTFSEKIIFLETEHANLETIRIFENHRIYIQKYFNIAVELLANSIKEDLAISSTIKLKSQVLPQKINPSLQSLVIIPLNQLLKTDELNEILSSNTDNEFHLSTQQYKLDSLFNEAFSKMLDIELLEQNTGKFNIINEQKLILKLNILSFENYLNDEKDRLILTEKHLGRTYILS